jgi:hypothetical protein
MTTIKIESAQIKDSFCNYSYTLTSGTGEGDVINRKGSAIIHDDLRNAFKKLNVHLAVICEEIESSFVHDIETLENIDLSEEHEGVFKQVAKYRVSGFKSADEGEGIVTLEGIKILSTGDYVSLKTPRVKWDGGYMFLMELRACIDDAIGEVMQYMEGKAAPKFEQVEISFGEEVGEVEQ